MNNIISHLENHGLGMPRENKVVLSPYNVQWVEAFLFEKERLQNIAIPSMEFHHIGSTAIPNIFAKPILDILVLCNSIEHLDEQKNNFNNLGYEFKGEYGIPGRRYCVLYNSEKNKSYIHIHGFKKNNHEAQKHLFFRDYLRENPLIAKKYEQLKFDLLKKSTDRKIYTESKELFIKNILTKAGIKNA